jgi:DNA-binding MarR family transcriptional regulator
MVQSPDPAFTAAEIGEAFDKTRQWGDQQLKELEQKGLLNSKNPGTRSRFYWVSEAGEKYLQETKDG